MTSSKAPNRDLLLAQHQFPGPYTIKAFGPGQGSEFVQAVRAAIQSTLRLGDFTLSERKSGQGNRSCVTIELQAHNVDEVIAMYEALHRIETLQLIL